MREHGEYVGVRKGKSLPEPDVDRSEHPKEKLVGGNATQKEVVCRLCLDAGRWIPMQRRWCRRGPRTSR